MFLWDNSSSLAQAREMGDQIMTVALAWYNLQKGRDINYIAVMIEDMKIIP